MSALGKRKHTGNAGAINSTALQNISVSNTTPTTGQVLTYTGGTASWGPLAPTTTFPTDLVPNITNAVNIGNAVTVFKSVVSNGIQAVDSVMYFNSGPNIRKITVTSPLPDDTMTTNTSTQTLTNKTLTAPTITLSAQTHVTNWTGIWASSQTGNLTYTTDGAHVSIRFPLVSATANTAANIGNSVVLPAGIRPPTALIDKPFMIQNNGATNFLMSTIRFNLDGSIVIFSVTAGVLYSAFTGSGVSGFPAQEVEYTLA